MSNVILTHPRFDRQKVNQPHPRLRRGTISFQKARAERLLAQRLNGRDAAQIRERAERLTQRWAQLDASEHVPLYIPNEGMEAHAVVRALMNAGLSVHLDTKRAALVLYAREPLVQP
jgi:hypothetical protein